MCGEKNLEKLLKNMTAVLDPDIYVFVTQASRILPEGAQPRMIFEEVEGTTIIIRKDEAVAFGLPCEFTCRMITLNIHSSLEAVGFIACIANALASEGMGVNPVSGFYHDHLFVPLGHENNALKILKDMRSQALARA